MKNLKNTLFNNKSLLGVVLIIMFVVGSLQNSMFFILPVIYFASISVAYYFGSKINDHGIHAAYNWSIKWALFVFFLYFTATFYAERIYQRNAFFYFN